MFFVILMEIQIRNTVFYEPLPLFMTFQITIVDDSLPMFNCICLDVTPSPYRRPFTLLQRPSALTHTYASIHILNFPKF